MTIPHTPADKTPEELAQFFDNNGLPNLGKTARVLDSMRQAHTPAEPEPGESKSVSRTTYQMTGKITNVRKGRPGSADHSDEVELDPAPLKPSDINVTKAKPQVTKALHNLPAAAAGKLDNILMEYAGRFSAIASMGRTDMVVQDIKDLEKRLTTLIAAQIQAAEKKGWVDGYHEGSEAAEARGREKLLEEQRNPICPQCAEAALGDNYE